MRETRAQHKKAVAASPAAETLDMHETRATATFALSIPHTIWKGLLFLVFYSMCCLRCAPDSSHSDISHRPPPAGLEMLLWPESGASHSNISIRPPTLPWPALAAALPFLRSLLPSAAAEWAKPSGSAAAHLPAWRVRPPTAYIFKPRASVSTGARICGCSDTRFFSCFIAISALNMRKTRGQHK